MTLSLVTGGSGFIGQHLVDQLVANGDTVRILDLEPPRKRLARTTFIQGSITDHMVLNEALGGVDHVYNLAAIPHLWIPNSEMYREVNVVGTRRVFEAALKAGVQRVVHTSSSTVLMGGIRGQEVVTLDEAHQTMKEDLVGHYARSKWEAERVALSFADKMSVVVVIPTLPIGPGDRHLTPPTRMLLDFVNGRNRAFVDSILNIIDVRDVAAGHRLAAARGRSGERYILNHHSLEMRAFLRELETITGRAMPRWRVPISIAVLFSAIFEAWSDLISGRTPIAPLAGTRMSMQPIVFDGRRAAEELGLPATPLFNTLRDAIIWLASSDLIKDEINLSTFAFGKD
jgi:dihydroflavonol-4-reductase